MAQKIGIIEDEIILLDTLKRQLANEGYEIVSELEGDSAFEMLKNEKPQLILLDLLLPGKDGFEVLKELKRDKETKDIPVIVLSNLSSPEDLRRCFELGAEDYFIKATTDLANLTMKVKGFFQGNPFPTRGLTNEELEQGSSSSTDDAESSQNIDSAPLQQPTQPKKSRFSLKRSTQ